MPSSRLCGIAHCPAKALQILDIECDNASIWDGVVMPGWSETRHQVTGRGARIGREHPHHVDEKAVAYDEHVAGLEGAEKGEFSLHPVNERDEGFCILAVAIVRVAGGPITQFMASSLDKRGTGESGKREIDDLGQMRPHRRGRIGKRA